MDIVSASALWYATTRVNCHLAGVRMARERPVLFVESVGARVPRAHEWRRMLARLARSLWPLRAVGPNLWVFSPLPLPFYRGQGAALNSRWVGWQVRRLLAFHGWSIDACWVFHPMGLWTARRSRARRIIYYCVDDHAANPGVDAGAIRALEAALVREADLTLTTGEPLARRFDTVAPRLRILPNVADAELFSRDFRAATHPTLAAIDALPRPRLGYLGNLAAYKIDIGLLYEIARRRPDWTIVLVGPRNQGDATASISASAAPPNLAFVGEIPHALAPAAIDRFDVCLLPAAQHAVMQASFPLKFFEYLLRGRPVVARPLPALAPYRGWYDEAVTAEEFVASIARVLAQRSDGEALRRREFAAQFDWSGRMRELLALREEILTETEGRVGVSA